VRPKPVRWLWDQRIAVGAVTVLAGMPGLGKSLTTTEVAARVSRGQLTGDLRDDPRRVLIATAEDALAEVVRPRLEAAGADLELIHLQELVVEGNGEARALQVPQDVETLGRFVETHDVGLVIVDPFNAFLVGEVNSWRDHDLRRALAPLARMAESCSVAVLIVVHLNSPLHRGPVSRIGVCRHGGGSKSGPRRRT
jgi:RecA-family ATPase